MQRVLIQQEPAAAVAAAGQRANRAHKWAGLPTEAEAGLSDRSCRPQRSPGATLPLLVRWVAQLRRQRWPCSSAPQPGPACCAAKGLARLRRLEPPVPT